MKNIFTKQAVIFEYPACDIVRREPHTVHSYKGETPIHMEGVTEIVASDILGIKCDGYHRRYSLGSVASYALEYNECPALAIEEAKQRGEKLHWINAMAGVLTSHKQDRYAVVEVDYGMLVRFEGLIATIEKDHNDNLKFVPVKIEATTPA